MRDMRVPESLVRIVRILRRIKKSDDATDAMAAQCSGGPPPITAPMVTSVYSSHFGVLSERWVIRR